MAQENLNETYAAWARIGGFVGFAITIYLFGFGSGYSGAQGLLIAGAKGFVGGGLGAGIFYCVAGLIYSPEIFLKTFNLALIIIFSAVAIFLLYIFSPKFNELVETASVEVLSDINDVNVELIKTNHLKEIVVKVSRDGQDLRMSTNSIPKAHTEDKIMNIAKNMFDHNHKFEVLIYAVNKSDDDAMEAINKFKVAGIGNVRKITSEDWLRLQDEWDNRK